MTKKAKKSKTTKSAKKANLHPCLCGCGKMVKRQFAQGHDQVIRSEVMQAFYADAKFSATKAQAEYLKTTHWMRPDIAKCISAR